jgi:excisionase family DNA binding protein
MSDLILPPAPVAATPEQLLFTLEQAALKLGVSVRTLRRAVDIGHVAVVRLGRSVRVHASELTRVARTGFEL